MRQKIGAFCGVLQQHDRARQPSEQALRPSRRTCFSCAAPKHANGTMKSCTIKASRAGIFALQ